MIDSRTNSRAQSRIATLTLLCAAAMCFPAAADAQSQFLFGNKPHKLDLSRTVVVGDSLSAGFQSDSLLDTQQPHGWASLVTGQAQVPLELPLIAPPGIPNVLELVSPGPPPIVVTAPGTSPGRDNPLLQATDLAVPGQLLDDSLNLRPTLPIASLTDLVLGLPGLLGGVSKSQVEWAEALQPTTVFVWIGNNDILGAASAGDPSAATPLPKFISDYSELMNRLSATGASIVVANIPDVTAIPYFTPTEEIAEETGLPFIVLGPILGIAPGEYVTPAGVALIPGILANPSTGPLPASTVLDYKKVLETRAIVDAYNVVIALEAFRKGATLVDIHALVNQIRARGYKVNGQTLTNAFLGGLFSLDGIHPTNTGYAVVANQFIQTLDSDRGAKIPLVNVSGIAETDPLIPPFTASASAAARSLQNHVTAASAQSMVTVLNHAKDK
jgi:GDSL-like lipase/acylhydrolase family protein